MYVSQFDYLLFLLSTLAEIKTTESSTGNWLLGTAFRPTTGV